MAQSIFAGSTSYDDQTLHDIHQDIKIWIQYTEDSRVTIKNLRNSLEESGYWNSIPSSFCLLVKSSESYFETILIDLKAIDKAIENSIFSVKEVKLLLRIGQTAEKFDMRYVNAKREDFNYELYSEDGFKTMEKIYNEARDLFLTLFDASNAASRLDDFVDNNPNNIMNFNDTVSNSTIQQGAKNTIEQVSKTEKPKRFFHNLFWKILVPICIPLIVAIILYILDIKWNYS